MISKKHIKEINENGFTIVKRLLKRDDIKHIFEQLDDVLNTILDFNKIKYNKKLSVDAKYFLLRKKKPILKSHFWDSIRILDSLNNTVFSKKILNLVKKILNKKTVFVTNYRLVTDNKLEPGNLALHQELNNISNDSVLLWCPFVKVNKKKGGLCVIPKSHKFGHLFYKNSKIPAHYYKVGIVNNILKNKEKGNYGNKIVKKLFNKKNLYFPDLNPGDAIIFKNFLFHGSIPYIGKGIRWTLISNFHKINKTPYILDEKFKSDKKYKLEMNRPMRIPYSANYNKII